MAPPSQELEPPANPGRFSGVRRALANEAEKVRDRLSVEDQARLESVFVRLVRLGDTGGATRRTASLDEFDKARRELVQQLGRDDYGRLVAVSEKSAEIAHEALITQWPWLQSRLKTDARDVRRLERLMDRSREWRNAPEEEKLSYFAFGADRELFGELAYQRPDWVSEDDRDFIEKSMDWKAIEQRREARRNSLLRIAVAALAFALMGVGLLYVMERRARGQADEAKSQADRAVVAADVATKEAKKQAGLAAREAETAINEENNADAATKDALAQKVLALSRPRRRRSGTHRLP
jgi:hypothetical protein